jgi:short-subunit dehydrogenase
MRVRLKPLRDQTIVITGGSSGHCLLTARLAARAGARVMLAARNEAALRQVADEMNRSGCTAAFCVADVGVRDDMERLAARTIERFGGFDSWINGAGTTLFGELERTPIEEQRRLFETNYWGVVYGSLAALRHLRQRGGALINMGSVLADRAVPLQGAYCATKFAVKAFTDALRMELMHDHAPVSVTLIKPAGIDTPLLHHARSHLAGRPELPPPLYAPRVVARAMLHACAHPVRDLSPGGLVAVQAALANMVPGAADRVMARIMWRAQQSFGTPPRRGPDNLDAAGEDADERSGLHRFVLPASPITEAQMHPLRALGLLTLAGASVLALAAVRAPRTSASR